MKFSAFTSFKESGDVFREAAADASPRKFSGVTLIKSGLGNKRDKHLYTPEALKQGVKDGFFNDLRAFVDHPTSIDDQIQPERTVRDFVGVYRNPKFIEGGMGEARIIADLHILKPFQWLAEGIRELVDLDLGDKIGISILGSGTTTAAKHRVAESGEEIDVQRVDKFRSCRSADIVTQAGAGGGFNNLLESARGRKEQRDMKSILEQIAEAADAGDGAKVIELTAKLQEAEADAADDSAAADTKEADAKPKPKAKMKEAAKDKKKKADDAADEKDGGADEADETKEAKGSCPECGGKMAEKALPGAGDTTSTAVHERGKGKEKAGQKFGESDKGVSDAQAELDALKAENAQLRGKVSATETLAYVTQKLTESSIPDKSKLKLVGKLTALPTKAAIDAEIDFNEALFEDAKDLALSAFEEVEGAGSTTGNGTSAATSTTKLREAFTGTGLKMKAKK